MKPRVHLNEIRFFIHPEDAANEDRLQKIVRRIARIICFDSQRVFDKKTEADGAYGGYRWQLDPHNDWWLDIGINGDASNEIVIAYRYALSPGMSEKMSKLRDTIIWLLHLEPYNID